MSSIVPDRSVRAAFAVAEPPDDRDPSESNPNLNRDSDSMSNPNPKSDSESESDSDSDSDGSVRMPTLIPRREATGFSDSDSDSDVESVRMPTLIPRRQATGFSNSDGDGDSNGSPEDVHDIDNSDSDSDDDSDNDGGSLHSLSEIDEDEDYDDEDVYDYEEHEEIENEWLMDYVSGVREEDVIGEVMEDMMMFHFPRLMQDLPNRDSDEEPRENDNDNENDNQEHGVGAGGRNDEEREEGVDDDVGNDVGNVHGNENYNDGNDSDASESSPCNCPQCIVDRIVGRCPLRCDDYGGPNFRNGYLGASGSDTYGNPIEELVHRYQYRRRYRYGYDGNGNDDDDDDDIGEPPLDPSASPCAICMEPETATRRFAHLPCCSGSRGSPSPSPDGRVPLVVTDTSSMRFCLKCLATYLTKNGCGVPRSLRATTTNDARNGNGDGNGNGNDAYRSNVNVEAQLAGECPRCKKLLVLDEVLPHRETRGNHNDKTATTTNARRRPGPLAYHERIVAVRPSAEAIFWYVARGSLGAGGAGTSHFRIHLVTLATCPNPHFIPEELLLDDPGSPERIRLLCQWGLISKETRRTWTRPSIGTSTTTAIVTATATLSMPFAAAAGAVARSRPVTVLKQLLNRPKWPVQHAASSPSPSISSSSESPDPVHESRIARLVRAFENHRKSLLNRSGTVYTIDPELQKSLRKLVVRHLRWKDPEDRQRQHHQQHEPHAPNEERDIFDNRNFNPNFDRNPNPNRNFNFNFNFHHDDDDDFDDDSESGTHDVFRLLIPPSPIVRRQMDADADANAVPDELRSFCDTNERRQTLLVACNCWSSAVMAACQFRLARSLRLLSWGCSLALLSFPQLGLDPPSSWPCNNGNGNTNESNHRDTGGRRWPWPWPWRWYAMEGLGVMLWILVLNIAVSLLRIALQLGIFVAACHFAGSWIGGARAGAAAEPETPLGSEAKRAIGTGILALYAGWDALVSSGWGGGV